MLRCTYPGRDKRRNTVVGFTSRKAREPKKQRRGTSIMPSMHDAMKVLRIAAVPVISILIKGSGSLCLRSAQAKPSTTAPAAPPNPVAALHLAPDQSAPLPVCLPDGKSQEPRKQISYCQGHKARSSTLEKPFIAHDGPFQWWERRDPTARICRCRTRQ